MKPRWKSVWMTPAASGAVAPTGIVQARDSFGPGGEVGLQAEGAEADPGQLVQTGLVLADRLRAAPRLVGVGSSISSDSILASRNTASAGATSARSESSEGRVGELGRRRR